MTDEAPLNEFQKYSKIPRLRGLRMTVTEKLDGTNAQVVVPEDPNAPLLVGSRNRWITPGKSTDNYDFALWAQTHSEVLRRLGPGRHYGEWWGVGIARKYNISERRWSLFNVHRYPELPEGLPQNMGLVPVLYQGDYDMAAVEACKERLVREGSVAAPGFMDPEGIVIKVQSTAGPVVTWKFTFDGDAKDAPSPEWGAL